MELKKLRCTSIFTWVNGNGVFGRNFDWYRHPALLLFTDPPDAFASVSMLDIFYLGFDHEDSLKTRKRQLLNTPFFPFDGMNEHGVTIGLMAVPHSQGGNGPNKVTITSAKL